MCGNQISRRAARRYRETKGFSDSTLHEKSEELAE
jgi:hypothetical protein